MSKIDHALRGQAVNWSPGELWMVQQLRTGPLTGAAIRSGVSASGIAFAENWVFALLAIGAHLRERPDKWGLTAEAHGYWSKRGTSPPVTAAAPPAAQSPVVAAAAKAAIVKAATPPARPATTAATSGDCGFAKHLAECQARAARQAAERAAATAPPARPILGVAAIYAQRRKQSGH